MISLYILISFGITFKRIEEGSIVSAVVMTTWERPRGRINSNFLWIFATFPWNIVTFEYVKSFTTLSAIDREIKEQMKRTKNGHTTAIDFDGNTFSSEHGLFSNLFNVDAEP